MVHLVISARTFFLSKRPRMTNSVLVSIKQFLLRHQLGVMLTGSILFAVLLVYIALLAYDRSGASSLDLSHPDYDGLRSQITTEKPDEISSTGLITEEFLNEFDKIFSERAKEAKEIDAFGGNVLSDEALGITQ